MQLRHAVPAAGAALFTVAAWAGPTVRLAGEMAGYVDSDAVSVASPSLAAALADPVSGWSVNGRYLVDAVSAASVDIVATASGRWTERRHVGALGGELRRGDVTTSVGGSVSSEPDYLALGIGGTLAVDLRARNVTPFFGLSYAHDDVGRTGMPHDHWHGLTRYGAQVGATIVVNRSTILALGLDAIFERGYLAKPYRYVPLFERGTAAALPPGASIDAVNDARLDVRPIEALPDARDRFAASVRLAHRFDVPATLRLEQRGYSDGWGMLASTTDARLVVDLGRRVRIWPHARFHAQTAVDLWRRAHESLVSPTGTMGVPRYRTGDRELGPLWTASAGGGVRWRLSAEGAAPWALGLSVERGFTRFTDTLYMTKRSSTFAALTFEAELP